MHGMGARRLTQNPPSTPRGLTATRSDAGGRQRTLPNTIRTIADVPKPHEAPLKLLWILSHEQISREDTLTVDLASDIWDGLTKVL